jgi:dynein heavy chain 2, cytosolic
LREAIQELKIWTEEARFELTSLVSNGKETPLIKEWKELMTKVSDNQSLLSSLKESKYFLRFKE